MHKLFDGGMQYKNCSYDGAAQQLNGHQTVHFPQKGYQRAQVLK